MKVKNKNKIKSTAFAISMISVDTINCINNINSYAQSINDSINLEQNTELTNILGEPKYNDNKVSFPNANYTNDIFGFEIKSSSTIAYLLDGKREVCSDGLIQIRRSMTSFEFSEFLKSIELNLTDNTESSISIKVSKEIEGYHYFERNGNFYKIINFDSISESLATIKENAFNFSLYGVNSKLLEINNDEEKLFIENISNNETLFEFDNENLEHFNSKNNYIIEFEDEGIIGEEIYTSTIKLPIDLDNSNNKDEDVEIDTFTNEENSILTNDNLTVIKDSLDIIEDITPPKITGIFNKEYPVGENIDILHDIEVIDDIDGNITDRIATVIVDTETGEIINKINPDKVGSYIVTYSVIDDAGNKTEKSSKIDVLIPDTLDLGILKNENGISSFPYATGEFHSNSEIRVVVNDNSGKDIFISYELDGVLYSVKGNDINTMLIPKDKIVDVLRSIKIQLTTTETVDVKVEVVRNGSVPAGTVATASSSYGYNTPNMAIDGDINTPWNSGTGSGWLQLNFPEPQYINNLKLVLGATPPVVNNYIVEGYSDGEWKQIGNENIYVTHPWSYYGGIDVEDGIYEKIKITCPGSGSWIAIAEINIDKTSYVPRAQDSLPIYATPDDTAPEITGVADKEITVGSKIDLMEGVEAIDNRDGNLTDKVKVTIESVERKRFGISEHIKEVPSIDTSEEKEYRVKYSVMDRSGNTIEAYSTIYIDKPLETNVEINLHNSKIEENTISFPRVRVRSIEDSIPGLKVSIGKGYESNKAEFSYIDNGIEKMVTDREFIIDRRLTLKEAQDILRSMKIYKKNDNSFEVNISVIDSISTMLNNRYNLFNNDLLNKKLRGVDKTVLNSNELYSISYIYDINYPTISDLVDETILEKEDFDEFKDVITSDDFGKTNVKVTYTNPNGDTVDTFDSSIIGDWIINYEVSDLAGNIVTAQKNLTVLKNNIKDIELELDNQNGDIKGKFNPSENVNYKLYRKDILNNEYVEILDFSNIQLVGNSLEFTDSIPDDETSPILEDYYLYIGKEKNTKVEIYGEDFVNKYIYQLRGFNKKGTLIEKSKEISKLSNISGIKGYVYVVDENPDTEVISNTVNNFDGKFEFNDVSDNSYLHVKAIDNSNNESNTLHIKLNDLSYNNKPIIYTAKNKVIEIGDSFNPMDGVTAYDYEDGNITSSITYSGAELVDTTKIGSYNIEYQVTDSKGLMRTENVTIHVTGTMDLQAVESNNSINLSWSLDPNAKEYEVYRTDADGYDYKLIGIVSGTEFIDTNAIDIKAPIISNIYEQNLPQEINSTNIVDSELKINSSDLASTYRYFVRSINSNKETLNSTNISNIKVKSDLKGFQYVIDELENTEVPKDTKVSTFEELKDAIKDNKSKYLHVVAVDNNNNKSDTIHYLIGQEYKTNFKPVITGLKNHTTLVGNKVNLLESVIANDYEDKDLTHNIEVIENIDYNTPGKYSVTYTVTDSHGNTVSINTFVKVVKYMDLTVTPNINSNFIELDWSNEALLNLPVYYEIRKWNNKARRFTSIGTTKETNFIDEKAKDVYGANYNGLKSKFNDDGTITITINSEDNGVYHDYQVVARLKSDNTIIGTMTDINTGEELYKSGSFSGGIAGYSWHLSNLREDIVDNIIDNTSNEITFDPQDYEWLHFAPIDSFGNKTDTVHIRLGKKNNDVDEINTAPAINVDNITVVAQSEFNPLSIATAYDIEDGDLTEYLTYTGNVDTNALGNYAIEYKVMDFNGEIATKSINVEVIEKELSISKKDLNNSIMVNSLDEDYVYIGENYNPMKNIKVESTIDGDITNNVKYTTDLNTNILGDYMIYYTVEDSVGNIVRFNRIVHVVELDTIITNTENIDITNFPYFNRFNNIVIGLGEEVNPKDGIEVYDIEDGNLTDKIKMSGTVNTIKPGSYVVTFRATDSDGNTSYVSRNVTVIDYNHENPEGDKPQNPDQGNNDNGNNGNIGTPEKPSQPNQPSVDNNTNGGSGSGNLDNENTNNDIYLDLELNIDIDKDGKPDLNIDTNKDGKPDVNIDINGDKKPDINIDTNGDKKPDINIDTNGDNKADINIDTNGDGKADINIDTNGDGKADINIDTNGDNKADINISTKPQTGDSILSLGSIFGLSLYGLIFNNRKKLK